MTSTGSGLAVPDWPLSYGTLFPPMVGGVFYEHGHRMVATIVGFLTLCLAIWLGLKEKRRWVCRLGFFALATVILQGLLGGVTVLFYLPTAVSVTHGIIAQTFFILTIIIAYSLSLERQTRQLQTPPSVDQKLCQWALTATILIFIQLILGAIMRHTHSGLAIPDFPTMGGAWTIVITGQILHTINSWRFDHNLDPVTNLQVFFHLIHRLWAVIILITIGILNFYGLKYFQDSNKIGKTLIMLDCIIFLQINLGILTILTKKSPVITSLHVVTGAITLGTAVLLCLRSLPTRISEFGK